jgi:hypothetical protein
VKLRSEKISYSDKPRCPKCKRHGIPLKDELGSLQISCSLCEWRCLGRVWFRVFRFYPRFEISFGPCSHCEYTEQPRRYIGTVSLFGISFILNCHSLKERENLAESELEPDTLDAEIIG